jgi:hypothetical protein
VRLADVPSRRPERFSRPALDIGASGIGSAGGERVVDFADRVDVFVEELDAGGLGEQNLANGEGEFLVQSLGVGLCGSELLLLGSLKQGLIPASEFGFELAPYAIQGSSDGFPLCDIVDTLVVKDGFELAAKLCTNERFVEEIELDVGVLKFLADSSQACLAVDEAIDDGTKRVLKIGDSCGWV